MSERCDIPQTDLDGRMENEGRPRWFSQVNMHSNINGNCRVQRLLTIWNVVTWQEKSVQRAWYILLVFCSHFPLIAIGDSIINIDARTVSRYRILCGVPSDAMMTKLEIGVLIAVGYGPEQRRQRYWLLYDISIWYIRHFKVLFDWYCIFATGTLFDAPLIGFRANRKNATSVL